MATKKNNKMNENATRVVCPNCGAEFEIPEHETTAKNVTVIGADSNLGTIYLKLKDRKQQLETAGVDVSKYFSMKTPGGGERLMKWDGDTPVAVTADDPVMKLIMDGGTIPNRDLFRRWVMAQVFEGLTYPGYGKHGKGGFTEWMHRKGYDYTWKMTEEEFRVQAKLWKKDSENFVGRNNWFDKKVACSMAEHYIEKLKEELKGRKQRKCKGVPYIKVAGKNIFVSDIASKIIHPLSMLVFKMRMAKTPDQLYTAFKEFNKKKISLYWGTMPSSAWISAYKGSGAYYTLKNMILFHECRFLSGKYNFMTKEKSLEYLELKAGEYKEEGWKLMGLLKEFIEYNHIDIKAKQAEWREKKAKKMNW